ncbi:MAG: hypothetical protein F7C37_02225 [Desulfurococcales archaeon]|nr:hypothetical protein [Desulfurococcales archaeon]
MHKCDVCRKKDAVYKRIYSGHKLCLSCLEKILARSVKRAIGDSNLLDPRSRILVPVRPSEPAHSLATIALLARVEQKFDATLILLIPQDLWNHPSISKIIGLIERRVSLEVIVKEFPMPKTATTISCLRYERAWSLYHARSSNAAVVAFPISRSCMNLTGLEALLSGNVEALSESLPVLYWTKPPLFVPTIYIESEALAAYAFLKGLYINPLCGFTIGAKIPLLSIMGRRPELEFSSNKTIMRIASKLTGLGKCRICGGFTSSGVVCRYCSETGASRFFPV